MCCCNAGMHVLHVCHVRHEGNLCWNCWYSGPRKANGRKPRHICQLGGESWKRVYVEIKFECQKQFVLQKFWNSDFRVRTDEMLSGSAEILLEFAFNFISVLDSNSPSGRDWSTLLERVLRWSTVKEWHTWRKSDFNAAIWPSSPGIVESMLCERSWNRYVCLIV